MDSESRCARYEPPPLNLGDPYCVNIAGNSEKLSNTEVNQFLKRIKNEARLCREMEAREKAQTAENPRIRDNIETSDICIEFQKQKHDELVQERRRKYLQEKYEDLRNLKLQIFLAHSSKYQATTAAELEQKRKQVFIDKKMETEKTRIRLLEELQKETSTGQEKKKEKDEMLCDLKEQMVYKEHLRKLEKEEKERERKQLEEYNKAMQEEHEEEIRKAYERKMMTKQLINDYLKERKEFQQRTRDEIILENEKAKKVQEDLERRNAELVEKKRLAWEAKVALSDMIGAKLDKIKKEKLYQENKLFDLLIEEREAKDEALDKKAAQDQAKLRRGYYIGYMQYQMSKQQENLEKKLETEQAIKDRIKLQEEMRKEDEALRAKDKERKEALKDQILYMMKEKELTKRRAKESELQFMAYLRKLDSDIQEEVKEERLNLLRAEPKDVLKYLPSKSITHEERKALGLLD